MNIGEFGGEVKLIDALVKKVKKNDVLMGAGDDAAVIKKSKDTYTLVSTELFVDENHFLSKVATPLQVGKKISEASISDIVAMGGKAKYILVCAGFRKNLLISYVRSIYRGIYSSCARHNVLLIGGDTVKSNKLVFGITVIGEVHPKNLKLRSDAKEGDLIRVTGNLGGSAIGRTLIKREYLGHEPVKLMYLEPFCRADIVDKLVPHVNAMIDVSDGLASEVRHICEKSGVGAEIFVDKIPIDKRVLHAGKALRDDPYNAALYGGEDFELVYTVDPKKENEVPGVTVGKITKDTKIYLVDSKLDKRKQLQGYGFQHF